MAGEWFAQTPSEFTEQRTRSVRVGYDYQGNARRRNVTQRVRAFRGVIVRKGDDGKPEYDRCPHSHQNRGTARKCAEAAAKRLNRGA